MAMLSAKSEVSVTPAITRRTKSVPTVETTPISSGIAAATTPRKTNSSSSARIGKAISSALVRSVARLVVGLVEARREAAHLDVERARGDQRFDPFGGDPALVLDVGGREVAGHGKRFAVAGDQLGAGARVAQRVDDAADVLDLRHPGAEPADLAAHGGAAGSSLPPPGLRTTSTIAGLGS